MAESGSGAAVGEGWVVQLENGKVLYEPEPKPKIIHSCTAPNWLYGGAAGGMKSHTLRWHGIICCLLVPGLQVLLLRREYTELNRTHLLKIYKEVPKELAVWKAGDQRLEFPPQWDGAPISMLHFGHCRAEQDFRKHLSTEWDLILVDESGELTPLMLELLPSRLRTTIPGVRPQYGLASNPGGEGHEYNHRRYILKDMTPEEDPVYDPDNYFFLYADWRDNPHIDQDEYRGRLEALPEFERRRFMGDWSLAPDRLFPAYSRAHHVYDEWDPDTEQGQLYKPWWTLFRSLDWGYSAATSIGWWLVADDHWLWRVRELYIKETDPEEQVPLVHEIDYELGQTLVQHANFQGIPFAGAAPRPGYTVADPAIWDQAPRWVKGPGPRLAERYMDAGLTDLIAGTNQRVPGWQELRRYINPKTTPELRLERRCYAAIKQLAAARRDDKHEEELASGQEDHALDDMRYAVMSRPQVTFRPVDPMWAKHEPGSPSWHEARHLVKINETKRKKGKVIHVDPVLGRIKSR